MLTLQYNTSRVAAQRSKLTAGTFRIDLELHGLVAKVNCFFLFFRIYVVELHSLVAKVDSSFLFSESMWTSKELSTSESEILLQAMDSDKQSPYSYSTNNSRIVWSFFLSFLRRLASHLCQRPQIIMEIKYPYMLNDLHVIQNINPSFPLNDKLLNIEYCKWVQTDHNGY